jgi:hypothetical protein
MFLVQIRKPSAIDNGICETDAARVGCCAHRARGDRKTYLFSKERRTSHLISVRLARIARTERYLDRAEAPEHSPFSTEALPNFISEQRSVFIMTKIFVKSASSRGGAAFRQAMALLPRPAIAAHWESRSLIYIADDHLDFALSCLTEACIAARAVRLGQTGSTRLAEDPNPTHGFRTVEGEMIL